MNISKSLKKNKTKIITRNCKYVLILCKELKYKTDLML